MVAVILFGIEFYHLQTFSTVDLLVDINCTCIDVKYSIV